MQKPPTPKAQEVVMHATDLLGSTRFQRRLRPVRSPETLFGWTIKDIANGGDDSCAAFASYVLRKSGLLPRTRSTVHTMLSAMERNGWTPSTEQVIGGIALWGFREDVIPEADRLYGHTGFYVGDEAFISHSSFEFVPVVHTATLKDGRTPVAYYTHEVLTEQAC